ncbi:hypothetical protein GTX53_24560 [Streptomyces sp. SID5594]|uniref:hypothetical protein n=1 Tax=unclassified Streptomyces TaxID=2593676 RepID=UPI00036C31AF|nr:MULTISPECIES: hypothetical protein [unclassified Streptomyces]MZF56966.1 hypothetical protein [Streptomyces sp. SID5594]
MNGQVQARLDAGDRAVQKAYAAFIDHTQKCDPCRTDGADCDTAAELKQVYRKAKDAAVAA